LVIAIDFRILFGHVKTLTDLYNAYLDHLKKTLEIYGFNEERLKIYGFDSSIVTDLQQKKLTTDSTSYLCGSSACSCNQVWFQWYIQSS